MTKIFVLMISWKYVKFENLTSQWQMTNFEVFRHDQYQWKRPRFKVFEASFSSRSTILYSMHTFYVKLHAFVKKLLSVEISINRKTVNAEATKLNGRTKVQTGDLGW
jgi:hypothetical protein